MSYFEFDEKGRTVVKYIRSQKIYRTQIVLVEILNQDDFKGLRRRVEDR